MLPLRLPNKCPATGGNDRSLLDRNLFVNTHICNYYWIRPHSRLSGDQRRQNITRIGHLLGEAVYTYNLASLRTPIPSLHRARRTLPIRGITAWTTGTPRRYNTVKRKQMAGERYRWGYPRRRQVRTYERLFRELELQLRSHFEDWLFALADQRSVLRKRRDQQGHGNRAVAVAVDETGVVGDLTPALRLGKGAA
jgi:hypothetical protein